MRLGDGSIVPADVIVVGIGVAPATGWLDGSGLTLRDGIVCDATLAAGPPGVYAAGDVARWPNALFGEEMRVEHWTNAAEQGAAAARNLLADGGGRGRRRRTRRCRSSGATRAATGSSSSGAAPPTTATSSRWSSAARASTASSPSTDGAAASGARSASTSRGW